VNVTLKWKLFGSFPHLNTVRQLWGLDGIKDLLKPYVPMGEYHEVVFFYPAPKNPGFDIANWTYPNDLNGATFTEVLSTKKWDDDDNLAKTLIHENIHRFHRELWNKGIATQDTLDTYDYPANEKRNLGIISIYFNRLSELPPAKYIVYLQKLIKGLKEALDKLKPSRINDWALAIKEWEGWWIGSRSYRNNNPGNLKYIGQPGAIGKDDENHAIFKDYASGFKALVHQLTIAVNGKSHVYNPEMTLTEFQTKYAEDNGAGYALFVAKKLRVPVNTKIKELL